MASFGGRGAPIARGALDEKTLLSDYKSVCLTQPQRDSSRVLGLAGESRGPGPRWNSSRSTPGTSDCQSKNTASFPLLQDIVYNYTHDDTLRQATRASKNPIDTMDMGTIATAVVAVDNLMKGEDKLKTEDAKRLMNDEEPKPEEDPDNRLKEMLEMSAMDAMMQKLKKVNPIIPDEKTAKVKAAEMKAISYDG